MSSKYKLEFTLKQHTPIIHFQSDQTGATLRATELKPKLDRFLLEKAPDLPKRKHPNGSVSLDYKIKISTDEYNQEPVEYLKKTWEKTRKRPTSVTLPTFFANMGDDWKKHPKKIVYTKGFIYITITSFHSELLEKIKEVFEEFIFIHTFGTRQSKGFGSFTLEAINGKKIEKKEFGDYVFEVDVSNNRLGIDFLCQPTPYFIKMYQLFEAIHRFHQVLRSGINERGTYTKPFIFYYAQNHKITWDKKTFKEVFVNHEEKQNSYLIRDLLGLSTEQYWRSYKFTVRHPKEQKKGKIDKFQGKALEPNEIKRFKTPFTYKPVQIDANRYKVYIVLHKINKKLFEKKFTILKEQDKKIKAVLEDMQMWDNFSLEDFFANEVYQNRNTLSDRINEKNTNQSIKKLVTDIYASLQKVSS